MLAVLPYVLAPMTLIVAVCEEVVDGVNDTPYPEVDTTSVVGPKTLAGGAKEALNVAEPPPTAKPTVLLVPVKPVEPSTFQAATAS